MSGSGLKKNERAAGLVYMYRMIMRNTGFKKTKKLSPKV